jgi:hypothetical protein
VTQPQTLKIDDTLYVRSDAVPSGKRFVVVLDRGWIVAGDVEDDDGRIRITRAVHVRSWSAVGFDGMIANPKSGNVTLKAVPNGFDAPADAEIFRVPVPDDWGL